MRIRFACPEDIPGLLEVGREFAEATPHDVQFDHEGAKETAYWLLQDPDVLIIVAEDDGIQGFLYAFCHKDFLTKPWGYLGKLYLRPKARAAGASRTMVEAMVEWMRQKGCSHVVVDSVAEIDPGLSRRFINLFKRCGFREAGPVLFRGLQ